MDAEWTFPIYPDLELDVNPDLTYTKFLEEQDALDTMLWEGLNVPSIDPSPHSEDVAGLGANLITDVGCVCDLPPLYCNQHGAYGNASMVDNPPSFNLQQTSTSVDNVFETVEHVAGPLELTEKNLLSRSLSHGSFEEGHVLCTNDQDTSTYAHRAPPTPVKALSKQRPRRANISLNNKHVLMAHFSRNRYPSPREIDELRESTGLDEKCIKVWFSNSRHRTAHDGPPIVPPTQKSQERSVSETPPHASTSVSAESLRKLDRLSPACSTTSLERYLATPLTEEAIPSAVVDSLSIIRSITLARETMQQGVLQRKSDWAANRYKQIMADFGLLIAEPTKERQAKIELRKREWEAMRQSELGAEIEMRKRQPWAIEWAERIARILQPHPPIVRVAGSVTSSDSSRNSLDSAGSWISQKSVDSRGPRRGRKSWVQVPNHVNATASTPETKGKRPATTKGPKGRPWYCTWPSCDKCFQFRSEWDRHETTVHHWPYHWVCNLDQETDTFHKDAASRIFYREDQLLVHMRGSHPGIKVTKLSVVTLKQDNPDFSPESLKCGFCHESLRSWEERQNHVAAHIKGGPLQERLPKSSWLVTRVTEG